MIGGADQGTHSLLRAVKLHKCHATGPPISMHHKVDAIRANSVPSKKPASQTGQAETDVLLAQETAKATDSKAADGKAADSKSEKVCIAVQCSLDKC